MQLDWSTIVLEIINFLVLVWILKRFLYKPVLDIIARRRAGIEDTVARAEKTRSEAAALKEQYEGRVADWEQERAKAREQLQETLDTERQHRLQALQAEVQAEREKARVADERRLAEAQRHQEQQAVAQSARFAAKLLGRLSSPELDARLVQLLLDELRDLPPERLQALREQAAPGMSDAEVVSARAVNDQQRQEIEAALLALFDRPIHCNFREDPDLIAGLSVTLGPWALRANLRDELQGFAELGHDAGHD